MFPAAAQATHTVDITSGPAGSVASTSADIAFTSSARSTAFSCVLDGGAATAGWMRHSRPRRRDA